MNKIKVLYILPSLAKGGAERLTLDTCHELGRNPEFEVKLIILNPLNEYESLSKNIDLEVCNSKFIPSILRKPIVDLQELNKIIFKFKPTIIHSNLFESEIVSRRNIFPDIIYVTHLHDNMRQFQNFTINTIFNKKLFTNHFEKSWILKRYHECNNNFVAISNDTKNYFLANFPQNLHRITLIPNAINLDKFSFPNNKNISKKEKINLISVGSLIDKKNQTFLIDVMKILIAKNYNVHLDILGEGANREKIQKKINNYGLKNNVDLKGNIDNVEEYLRNSSIYVHSAIYEPFGLVFIEAMASGLPCVALDGRGNRDIVLNEFNGYILSIQNPELFAEKIITLIERPDLYREMSKNAFELSKKYNIKDYSNSLAAFYKNLIAIKPVSNS